MPRDDGIGVDYTALQRGTPVYSSDEVQVGTVAEVLDNAKEHIFDGLVIDYSGGGRRFVDAPEVRRTAERGVTLVISAAEAERLPPPETTGPSFRPRRAGGPLSRLLGGWRRG